MSTHTRPRLPTRFKPKGAHKPLPSILQDLLSLDEAIHTIGARVQQSQESLSATVATPSGSKRRGGTNPCLSKLLAQRTEQPVQMETGHRPPTGEVMKKNRSPRRGKSLELRLSDFCMPDSCTEKIDVPISISSQALVQLFEDGITAQLNKDARVAKGKRLVEEAKRALGEGRNPPLDDFDTICTGDQNSPDTSEASETESDGPASSESDGTSAP